DDSGLQGLVYLGESHHLRGSPKRAHLQLEDLRGLDPQLQSMKVLRRMQRPVGAHEPEAVVPVGESENATRLEQGQHFLPKRPLGDPMHRLLIGEEKRNVENIEFPHTERPELRERGRNHLDRAKLQRLELFFVLVKLRIWVDVDVNFSGGVTLCQ